MRFICHGCSKHPCILNHEDPAEEELPTVCPWDREVEVRWVRITEEDEE